MVCLFVRLCGCRACACALLPYTVDCEVRPRRSTASSTAFVGDENNLFVGESMAVLGSYTIPSLHLRAGSAETKERSKSSGIQPLNPDASYLSMNSQKRVHCVMAVASPRRRRSFGYKRARGRRRCGCSRQWQGVSAMLTGVLVGVGRTRRASPRGSRAT